MTIDTTALILRAEFWTYVVENDKKFKHLDKRISDLEREEYKNWKRISELEESAGKSAGNLPKEKRGFTKAYEAFSNLYDGTWIRLSTWQCGNDGSFKSYMNFVGKTGTIVENNIDQIFSQGSNWTGETRQRIRLRMDESFDCLEPYDNCIIWEIEERLSGNKEDDCLYVESDPEIPEFDILVPQGQKDLMDIKLYSFERSEFPLRLQRLLELRKIFTIGDLVQNSEQDLLKQRHFGRMNLRYVKAILRSMGLSLKEVA